MNASLALARFELATRDPAAHQRLLALEAKSGDYQHEILKLNGDAPPSPVSSPSAITPLAWKASPSSRIIPLGFKW